MSIQIHTAAAYAPTHLSSAGSDEKDSKDCKVANVAQMAIAGKEDEKIIDAEGRNVPHLAEAQDKTAVLEIFADRYKEEKEKKSVGIKIEVVSKIKQPTYNDKEGLTPLLLAASRGDLESCKALSKYEANIEATSREKYSVLHLAVISKNTDLVQFFSADNRFLESQDEEGYTPFLLAIKTGNRESCELLMLLGADVKAKTRKGHNALHLAIENGCSQQLLNVLLTNKLLLEKDFLESQEEDGYTPLLLASKTGSRENWELLLKLGANAEATNLDGDNALHVAIKNGSNGLLPLLLTNRRLLEMKDTLGRTPLLLVMSLGRYKTIEHYKNNDETLRLLLNAGADQNATNKAGQTALAVAKEENYTYAIRILTGRSLWVRSFLNFLGCKCCKKKKN